MKLLLALVAALAVTFAMNLGGVAHAAEPACADFGLAPHGTQHVVPDYVIGDGTGPGADGRGAATPGGPGPGFHFAQDPPIAPGASFCIDKSQSPGLHP